MEQYKREFIEFMVECGVLKFGEFKTKSGRLSPYFINTGNYRTGSQINRLGEYYASCISASIDDYATSVLFGPAYKGIPLAVTAAASLSRMFNSDVPFCFNRKEAKDHGEGGSIVGAKLNDGDKVIIIEDVMTAGTAVRETLPILNATANVTIRDMIISVDRMERGLGGKTAVNEVKEEFGIIVHPIVTVSEIIEHLHNRPVNGEIILNDEMRFKMEAYLDMYCEKI